MEHYKHSCLLDLVIWFTIMFVFLQNINVHINFCNVKILLHIICKNFIRHIICKNFIRQIICKNSIRHIIFQNFNRNFDISNYRGHLLRFIIIVLIVLCDPSLPKKFCQSSLFCPMLQFLFPRC